MPKLPQHKTLKAYWVDEGPLSEWGMYLHAETPGKAKVAFLNAYPLADWSPEYTSLRVLRFKNGDGESFGSSWIFCKCEACKNKEEL